MKNIFFSIFLLTGSAVFSQSIQKWKIADLEKYIGNKDGTLIVNFWATWCKPCIEELPYYHTLSKKYRDQKVELLLVSLDFQKDYPKKIEEFARKNGYSARIVWLDETDADYFCPAIDSSWQGAIPATLMVNRSSGFRFFHEGQVRAEKLEMLIQNSFDKGEAGNIKTEKAGKTASPAN